MGEGLKRAFGTAAVTNLTEAQIAFLRALPSDQGVATARDLGPQTTQKQNSARQRCKRLGLVVYDGSYWRLTDIGRAVFNTHKS
jgi:hypothetical protein